MTDMGSFRLSPEARALLREHTDFFAPLVEVHQLAEVPLRIQGKDIEAHTETHVLPNGDREVVWIYPIDDNDDPGDGRLYLRDTFSFDPSERVLKNFRREIDAPPGLPGEWENYLKQHRLAATAAAWQVGDTRVARFARQVATGFSRPMAGADGALSEALHEALLRQADYLRQAGDLARRWKPDWKLKAGDPQSHYALIPRGRELEIILNLAVDTDGDPERDRIFLRERFIVDSATGALISHERLWETGSEPVDPVSRRALEALRLKPGPSMAEAQAFIGELSPLLLPSPTTDPLDLLSAFARRNRLGEGVREFAGPEKPAPALARESLEAIHAVAQETLAQGADASRGWGHFGKTWDEAGDRALLAAIFQKAEVALKQGSGELPFALLQGLTLSPPESRLRDRMFADPVLQELNDLARESDPQLRAEALALLAREKLLLDRGLPQSALWIAEALRAKGEAASLEIFKLAEGRGNFGEKFDFFLPRFSREVAKPSMLLGMAAAPFLGTGFELLGLRLARWGNAGRGIAQIGRGQRFGAAVLGMGGEALAFTGIHRGMERWSHGAETAWRGAGPEILSAMFLFGGLRLAHHPRWMSVATGKWAPLWRQGSGLAAMTASGYLSRGLGLAPDNGQGFGGHLLDSSVMYLQAMVGFRIANTASGGNLQGSLARFRGRLEPLKSPSPGTIPPLGSAILMRPEGIPSLRLFDLNQGGLQSDFHLAPGRDASLDFLLFGGEGKKVRLFADAQGQVFLEDKRDRILPWAFGANVNLREQSILHNGAPLTAGQAVRLRGGDMLFLPVRNLKVTLPRQSDLFRELAATPEAIQRELAEATAQAYDLKGWLYQLEARGDATSNRILSQVQEVMAGKRPLYELPTELGVLGKVRAHMEAELHRWERAGLYSGFYVLQPAHIDGRWTHLEKSFHALRAVQALEERIHDSRSIGEIQGALENSRLESIEGISLPDAIYTVAEVLTGSFPQQAKLPYAAAIRQRVRDIYEWKTFREFEAYQRNDSAIPLPDQAAWREEYIRLDSKRVELQELIRRGIPMEEADQVYGAAELEERLYQVLERGKPLSLLPRAGRLRSEAAVYQKWAVRTARELFPPEMNAEVDPWTGENIAENGEEAQYRLAMHVLNSYGRRPVTGMPSSHEIQYLHTLVSRHLDPNIALDYPILQETLRRHWDGVSPHMKQMLLKSSPQDKAMLLHHYFGSYRRRDMTPEAAFQTAFWMGQSGMYRETGFIYENFRGNLRSTFALGEMGQVSSAGPEDYFLLHTHPEIYLDMDGRLMGFRSEGGAMRTIAWEVGKSNQDTSLVLPSVSDIWAHFQRAQDYWKQGFPKFYGNMPNYDASGRVFRNWVVHPQGLSEMRVFLGEAGLPTAVEVRFALHGAQPVVDQRYLEQQARLEALAAQLGVPVTVQQRSYPEMLEHLPFPVQPLF